MNGLPSILGVLFGVGGVGAITVLVKNYRTLKTGHIDDEEAMIVRLHRELEKTATDKATAEAVREREALEKQAWREQAWSYRVQLIAAGIAPDDHQIVKGKAQ